MNTSKIQMLALNNFAHASGLHLVFTDDDTFFRSNNNPQIVVSFNSLAELYNEMPAHCRLISSVNVALDKVYLMLIDNEIIMTSNDIKFVDENDVRLPISLSNEYKVMIIAYTAQNCFSINAREVTL